MGRWGDGESSRVGRHPAVRANYRTRSRQSVRLRGRWGDKEKFDISLLTPNF
jgi:hypothetical protein